jgi:hypothetical protein
LLRKATGSVLEALYEIHCGSGRKKAKEVAGTVSFEAFPII